MHSRLSLVPLPLLLVVLCSAMLASATEFESAIQNLNGVWDVGLAVEGAPPLAYHHILNVSEGRILATPRPSGGLLEEFLDAVGELLRVSRTTIPDTDERTCRFPSDLWNRPLEVVVSPSGARITSGCGLAFSCAHHRLNDVDVFVSDGGEDGVQLMRMGDDGHCSTVPWRMRRGYARLSKDTAVIAVELISTINNESCHSVLDGQRRPRMRTTASTAPPLTSALLIAFAVMLRATKRWWGHAKAKPQPRRQNLTPEVRRELLRRQREIIAKMKEEDRLEQSRNPPHMKAAADSK